MLSLHSLTIEIKNWSYFLKRMQAYTIPADVFLPSRPQSINDFLNMINSPKGQKQSAVVFELTFRFCCTRSDCQSWIMISFYLLPFRATALGLNPHSPSASSPTSSTQAVSQFQYWFQWSASVISSPNKDQTIYLDSKPARARDIFTQIRHWPLYYRSCTATNVHQSRRWWHVDV